MPENGCAFRQSLLYFDYQFCLCKVIWCQSCQVFRRIACILILSIFTFGCWGPFTNPCIRAVIITVVIVNTEADKGQSNTARQVKKQRRKVLSFIFNQSLYIR